MTVKEIVKHVATYLGKGEVIEYLDKGITHDNNLTKNAVLVLTGCVNTVLSELSQTYIPMVKEEKVKTINGEIKYSDLQERIVKIISIKDDYGDDVNYKFSFDKIMPEKNQVNIKYNYQPSNYGLDDVIGYSEVEVPLRILSYGVCAEYLLIEGKFSESITYHSKYMNALSDHIFPKNSKIKERSWF